MIDLKKTERDFTILEACEFFRVTPPTIYRMLNEGRLSGYTIGRSRRITQESIHRLREARS